MTLWLFAGLPPFPFKEWVVTCIPKGKDTSAPIEFRPITVGPIMNRLFHQIINRRLLLFCPFSAWQKAFRHVDGLGDNLWLAKAIIDKKRMERKKLNLTFVDVAKAFDSVSHHSIIRAPRRLGTPPMLTNYLTNLYSNCRVYMKMEKDLSEAISVGRGVRQGDPMSPMLFNAVIDMFMDKIDNSIGVTEGSGSQEKCNYIAFADDLLLLSSTVIGRKTMMKQLEAEMANVVLVMIPEKCASMRTEVVSKRKQWIVNPTPYLKLQEKEIKALSITDTYKYLDISVSR